MNIPLWRPPKACRRGGGIIPLAAAVVLLLAGSRTINAGLVGYWNFNEGTGVVLHDFSANTNNGTIYGSPAWIAGHSGGAGDFALSFSNNTADYVEIADAVSLHIGSSASTNFTIAAWVYDKLSAYGEVFCYGTGARNLFWQTENNNVGASYFWSASNGNFQKTFVGLGSANAWHHIAITYDGANIVFYLDGTLRNTAGCTAVLSAWGNLRIGKSGTNIQPWNGYIDDVLILDNAASGTDIAQIMSGTYPAMLRYWTGGGAGPTNNWTDATNWGGAAVGPGKSLIFDTTNALTSNYNDFPSNTQFAGITFLPSAGPFVLNGHTAGLSGDVVNNSTNPQTIALTSLALYGGSRAFNAATGTIFVSNTITEAAGQTNGLVKTGIAALVLTASNTYSGATSITNGMLRLAGPAGALGNTAVTVSGPSASLAGTGSVGGLVTVEAAGHIIPGDDTNASPGTITLSGGLTLDNANLDLKFGDLSTPAACDHIGVSNDLTLTGDSHLAVNTLSGFGYGTNVFLTYSGNLLGSGRILGPVSTPLYRYQILTNTPHEISLYAFYPASTKTWAGQVDGVPIGTWDVGVTTNWISGGLSNAYFEITGGNDPVIFDDSATGTTDITLDTTVSPASVTFSNSLKSYTVSGSGCIAGGTTLTACGGGTVTLNTSNSFSGDTVVSAGSTLILGNTHALAGSTLNYDNQGGTVSFGGLADVNLGGLSGTQSLALVNGSAAAITLTVGGSGLSSSYSGDLTGAGSLVKSGTNVLALTTASTYSGTTTVKSGTLTVTTLPGTDGVNVDGGTLNAQSFNPSAPLSIAPGATANISGTDLSLASVTNYGHLNFTGSGGTITLAGLSGPGTNSFAALAVIPSLAEGTVNLDGQGAVVTTLGDAAVHLGTAGTVITIDNGSQTTGSITGPGSIAKNSPGTLILQGTNTYGNGTTVNGGTLQGSIESIAGNVVLNNDANVTYNQGGPALLNRTISGTGSVTKTGAGTLNIDRRQTYNGPTTIADGVVRLQKSEPNFRFYRFTPTAWKGTMQQQLSELQFFLNNAWTAATTVTAPGTSSPGNEMPANANDNNTGSKWYSATRVAIVYDFGTGRSFNEYNWATANDQTPRDPIRWKVEGSDDNVTWYLTDDRTGSDQSVTDVRNTWVGPGASRFSGWSMAYAAPLGLLPTNSAVSIPAGAQLDLNGINQQIASLSDYSGSSGTVINSNATSTSTLILNAVDGIAAFGGVIAGGSGLGTINLIKSGGGTQILSGTNTYTGTTTVSGGMLRIGAGGVLSNTAVTVSGTESSLAGIGTVYGPVTVEASGHLVPGADTNSTLGTLTLVGGLSLNAACMDLKFGATGGPVSNDVIAVTGDLMLTNDCRLTVRQLAGFGYGTNVFLTYSGNLTANGRIIPPDVTPDYGYEILTNAAHEISLRIFQPPPIKIWNGREGDIDIGTWDIAITTNWIAYGSHAVYEETVDGGDLVVFDDSATGTTVVVLDTTVSPLLVTFTNVSKSYSISGSGSIAGTTILTLGGGGAVTLSTTNTFSGNTILNAGTLTLGNPLALGGSTLDYNNQGGTLSFGSLSTATLGGLKGAQDLNLDNTLMEGVSLAAGLNDQDTTYRGVLSGSGSFSKVGSGTLTLSGTHTYSGATMVNNGILNATNLPNTSLLISSGAVAHISQPGQALVAVTNSGILSFDSTNGTVNLAGLAGTGTTTFAASAGVTSLSGGTVHFEGSAASVTSLGDGMINLARTATVFTVAYGSNMVGGITGPGRLVKTGNGILVLGDTNTYTGTTSINGGTLSAANLPPNNTVIFNTGTLEFTGASGLVRLDTSSGTDFAINVTTGNLTVSRNGGNYNKIVKGGAGMLTIANTWWDDGGDLVVNQGTAVLAGTCNIGVGCANVSSIQDVKPGAVVTLGNTSGGQLYYDYAFHMSGGTFNVNGLSPAFGQNTCLPAIDGSGTIINNATSTVGTAVFKINGFKTFSGNIVDGPESGRVAVALVAGTGTWTISGTNTYSGATTVSSGTLTAGSTTAFSSNSAYTVATRLNLDGYTNALGSLAGAGNVTLGAGSLTVGADNTSPAAFTGVISGSGSFTKIGSGTMIMTSTNTYVGGTSILGGTLRIDRPYLFDTSDVHMAGSARLNLNFVGTDKIRYLYIDGVPQVQGTWGATGSGAEYISDTHFAGTGKILVTLGPDLHGVVIMIK